MFHSPQPQTYLFSPTVLSVTHQCYMYFSHILYSLDRRKGLFNFFLLHHSKILLMFYEDIVPSKDCPYLVVTVEKSHVDS